MTKNGQILSLVYEKIPSVKDAALTHGYSLRNVGRPRGYRSVSVPESKELISWWNVSSSSEDNK